MVETVAKGPESKLPSGHSFKDKNGDPRYDVRVKWWSDTAKSCDDIAMSVPDVSVLPMSELPNGILQSTYPKNAKPVFFGHYWLSGEPVHQSKNALCLDYSAGKEGPLVAYRFDEDAGGEIDLANILSAPR